MEIEVLIILNKTELYHRSVSTLNEDINPYTGAINALISDLTQGKAKQTTSSPKTNKFAEAVPYYNNTPQPLPALDTRFHPDLIKAGVATKNVIPQDTEIPVVKVDMKTIFKDKK